MSVRLGKIMERIGVLPTILFLLIGKFSLHVITFVRVPYTEKCIGELAGG